jgi:hypothetical protein
MKMLIKAFSFDSPKINDFGWVMEETLRIWWLKYEGVLRGARAT